MGHSWKPDDLYNEIKGSRSDALKRSAKLLKRHHLGNPERANPSTTIHILVGKLINEPGYREEE